MRKLFCLIGMVCLFFLFFWTTVLAAQSLVSVTGDIESTDSTDCRGMVSLWPVSEHSIADPGSFNNVPPIAEELAPDCSFVVNVAPGRYYLQGVLRKTSGHALGPLRAGDVIFMTTATTGDVLPIEVHSGRPLHVGVLTSPREFLGYSDQVNSGVTGRLVDSSGEPVSGLVVQAFGGPNMNDRFLALSAPSDESGFYQLRLAGRGELYLLARDEAGLGLPPIGRYFGVYGGTVARPLTFSPGTLVDNLEIVVRRRTAEDVAKEPR